MVQQHSTADDPELDEFHRVGNLLDCGPNPHFTTRCINELLSAESILGSSHFLSNADLAHAAEFSPAEILGTLVSPEARESFILGYESRRNPVKERKTTYSQVALIAEPGEPIRDYQVVLASYKVLILNATMLDSSLSADNRRLIKNCAYQAYQAFRLPDSRSEEQVPDLDAIPASHEERLPHSEVKLILKAINQSKSVFGFFNATKALLSTPKKSRLLTTLLNATSELAIIFTGSVQALVASTLELRPSGFLFEDPDSVDSTKNSKSIISLPYVGDTSVDAPTRSDDPVQSAQIITLDEHREVPDSIKQIVEKYEVSRSFGKLFRASHIRAYSKLLFNPIERRWMSDHFAEELKKIGNPEVIRGNTWVLLSMCTGIPAQYTPPLIAGESPQINQATFWQVSPNVPENAAEPPRELRHLYEPIESSIWLRLPGLVSGYLNEIQSLGLVGDLEPTEQVKAEAKASIERIRKKRGSRFRIERVESQLRYWIALNTRDLALVDLIFGHGEKLVPIQRYYRCFLAMGVEETYHLLASKFFELN